MGGNGAGVLQSPRHHVEQVVTIEIDIDIEDIASTLAEGIGSAFDSADDIPDEDIETAIREAIDQSLKYDAPDVSDAIQAVRAAFLEVES